MNADRADRNQKREENHGTHNMRPAVDESRNRGGKDHNASERDTQPHVDPKKRRYTLLLKLFPLNQGLSQADVVEDLNEGHNGVHHREKAEIRREQQASEDHLRPQLQHHPAHLRQDRHEGALQALTLQVFRAQRNDERIFRGRIGRVCGHAHDRRPFLRSSENALRRRFRLEG